MNRFDAVVACPKCGTWGAKKSLWKVKCINPSCEKFDSEHAQSYRQSRAIGKAAAEVFTHLKGKADPNDYTLKVRYHNFRGDEIIYSADPTSAYQTGPFVVLRLAPTGRRVTFKLERIDNRSEIEQIIRDNPQPSGRDRRVLRYHLRRGTSSPLFEELRKKYPNYQD